jgi:hypothetical protein
MRPEISHDDAFAALGAIAIDALDVSEREIVYAHIETCTVCSVELSALRDAAALIAFSSPLAADTATRSRGRIRSKLVSRAVAEGSGAPAPATSVPQVVFPTERPEVRRIEEARARRWRPEWFAIAASVLFIASATMLAMVMRDRETLQGSIHEQLATLQQVRTANDSLRVALMSRDSMIAGITGKDVAMMTLASTAGNAPFAHMFWDKSHNTWTLVAHNMPVLKSGRTYQLWLVTPRAKISAGTFMASNGEAMMRSTYALPTTDLRAMAVTEEPMGGMPQPTSAPVIAGGAH